jgi:tetratricopeptide (TPR) repeat protein
MRSFPSRFLLCAGLLFALVPARSQNHAIDSINALLQKDAEDSNKVDHLVALCNEWSNLGSLDTAFYFGNNAIRLAEQIGFNRGTAVCHNNLGIICWKKGDLNGALDHYGKAYSINKTEGILRRQAQNLNNLGIVYRNLGNYPKALENYLEALKLDEQMNNRAGMATRLGNIGLVYSDEGEFEKALEYYSKAMAIDEGLNNKRGMARHLGNSGNVYYEMGLRDKKRNEKTADSLFTIALQYYEKAGKLNTGIGDLSQLSTNLSNQASAFAELGNFDLALEYNRRAFELAKKMGDLQAMSNDIGNMGLVYLNQKKYPEAMQNIFFALHLADSLGSKNILKDQYKSLSDLYEVSPVPLPDTIGGKILTPEQMRIRSKHFFEHYIALRDRIFSEENKKELVRKEMNYEFDKKEMLANAEREKKDAVQAMIRNALLGGLALVVILALVSYQGYRNKRDANIEISRQKQIIEEKHTQIVDSINYAKRIQRSLLPGENYIVKVLQRIRKQ